MITKSWHCIFVDPYLHIWSFEYFLVFNLCRLIEVSSPQDLERAPRMSLGKSSHNHRWFLTTNFTSNGSNGSNGWTIADSWQTNFRSFSITEQALRSGDDKSSWRHLVVVSSSFHYKLITSLIISETSNFSDRLLIIFSDHLKWGNAILAVASWLYLFVSL